VEEKKMKKTKNNTKQIYQSGPQTLEFYMYIIQNITVYLILLVH